MKRGHETIEHVEIKRRVAAILRQCGWIVIIEAKCVDITAFRPGFRTIWAIEGERHHKWVARNCLKALALGVDHVLVLAMNEHVAANARRIVAKLDATEGRILVATVDDFTVEFVRGRMEGT